MSFFDTSNIVFQPWMFRLTMQQQSVLVLACRGPDNVRKYHPCKEVVARYRACVLKAAYLGRAMVVDEGDDTTFMTMRHFSDSEFWTRIVRDYFDFADELPHHYTMHLMHGAEIIGYKHQDEFIRSRWALFYQIGVHALHLTPETEVELDARLCDWDRAFWYHKVPT